MTSAFKTSLVKVKVSLQGSPSQELQGVTCHMGSQSVTRYTPHLNCSQTGWYFI